MFVVCENTYLLAPIRGAHSIRKNRKIEPIRPIRVGLGRFMEAADWVRFQFLKIR